MNKLLPVVLAATMAFNSFLGVRGTDYEPEENVCVSTEVITDTELIRQMALEDGIDPDSVEEIIIEKYDFDTPELPGLYTQKENSFNGPDADKMGTFYTRVNNWQCVGDYYYPSEEQSDHIDGPADVTTTYSVTANVKLNGGFSLESKYVKAQLGVELGAEKSYSKSITVNVPSNKKVNIKYYPNYKRWTCDVYYEFSDCMGLWYPQGQGIVMNPCGIIVRQYVSNK